MRDRALITTGIAGAVITVICCATPVLAILFGALGLTAWLARADLIVIPALLLCAGLVAFGLYLKQRHRMKASDLIVICW